VKRVVLFTNHYLQSRNKAGFHWLADAYWRAGWDVLVFTESISWLSWLRGDRRFDYPIFHDANRLQRIRERLSSYVWLTPFHPMNLRSGVLNRLSGPVLKLYGRLPLGPVTDELRQADLFVFDSDHGLFLLDRIKRLNPHARCVYRVSDDIPTMRHHPVVLKMEESVVPRFDAVSVPSEAIGRRLGRLTNVTLQHHGLRKDLFDRPCVDPYLGPGPFVLFIGRRYLDTDFLRQAVDLYPNWSFHVFGEFDHLPAAANLTAHGERPFDELIPYLRHADIGLQTLSYIPGAECFTDSLKVQQYTYCRLPIVAPSFLRCDRPNVLYYEPGDGTSIRCALDHAIAFDRRRIGADDVATWDEIAARLAA
jgi:2-beta-glucuronyltransferase